MDSIDVLGPRPDRHAAFNRELLAEAEDEELKAIVEQAAQDLKTPIALVNLELEHIQFFIPASLPPRTPPNTDMSIIGQLSSRDPPSMSMSLVNQEGEPTEPCTLLSSFLPSRGLGHTRILLAYQVSPVRLTVVQHTIERFITRATQLYEQEPGASVKGS